MTTLREAAQHALEALELARLNGKSGLYRDELVQVADAITALRAALAESARDWSLLEATQASLRAHMSEIQRLRAALAEPVLEPVAWMVYTPDGKSVCVTDNPADFTEQHKALPLFTAPPRRKPLTLDEIPALAEKALKPSVYWDAEALLGADGLVALVRAIERAHGIKE